MGRGGTQLARGSRRTARRLVGTVEWRQRRRRMYDQVVDEPRLTRWLADGDPLPHPALDDVRRATSQRHSVEFGAMALNFSRDGSDSVAWHGDRDLRRLADTLVAVVTMGGTRPFLLRPLGGGPSIDLRPASADLIVMRGACQLRWQHCVPKVAAAGRRISASLRWAPPNS